MENLNFIDLTYTTAVILFLVGFVGGMVSGFIGSGGAFVLTPAMMSLGVPGVVAVASNMAHKFPKALVGAHKRNKYGQVDIKLGVVLGIFAEAGVLFGKHLMVGIKESFGAAGTNLYVSVVFVVVLGIVGSLVLRDAIKEKRGEATAKATTELPPLTRWVRSINIPWTMMYFKSMDARVSVLFLAPMGFATGLLAATIAVGGFIGVPAMMYFLGLPALIASATELVIAFVMGLGGTFFYALDGYRGHSARHDHPGRLPVRHPDRRHRDHLCEGLCGQVRHGGHHAAGPGQPLLLHPRLSRRSSAASRPWTRVPAVCSMAPVWGPWPSP